MNDKIFERIHQDYFNNYKSVVTTPHAGWSYGANMFAVVYSISSRGTNKTIEIFKYNSKHDVFMFLNKLTLVVDTKEIV